VSSQLIHKQTLLNERPVPEWECCVVYTPHQPALYILNLNSWLIFELCDGRSTQEIMAQYLEIAGDRCQTEAVSQFEDGLKQLIESELVVITELQIDARSVA